MEGRLSAARQTLREVWGFADFRGLQGEAIGRVLDGEDSLVVMPTGGGKSLCYQLPAVMLQGLTVVISPLIALMNDQVEALRALGIRAAALHSGLSDAARAELFQSLHTGELQLLYISPERALAAGTKALLQRHPPALFAIDEAHCVLEWGHDFRPEYLQLAALLGCFPDVAKLALTATADPAARQRIVDNLNLGDAQILVASFDRPNIHYAVSPKSGGVRGLLSFIRDQGKGAPGIVYCLSRKKTERVAEQLQVAGITARAYHAGLDAELRQQRQQAFRRDEVQVIVATVAFGMGIDKPNVRFVAHMDLPKSLESYYQETGRAGRDGEPARAWLNYGLADVVRLKQFLNDTAAEHARAESQRIEQMLAYCEGAGCRHQALLAHFGEDYDPPCNNCDNCDQPPKTEDITEAARMGLSAIYRTGQRFGLGHVIDVLRGVDNERCRHLRHDQLQVFGMGQTITVARWRAIFRQLLAQGMARVDGEHGSWLLTEHARPLLRGEDRLEMVARAGSQPTRSRTAQQALDEQLTPEQQQLFEALKAERLVLAREHDVPAYVIFHDRTLIALAQHQPADDADLLTVPGIGASKAERYGQAMLAVLDRQRALS